MIQKWINPIQMDLGVFFGAGRANITTNSVEA